MKSSKLALTLLAVAVGLIGCGEEKKPEVKKAEAPPPPSIEIKIGHVGPLTGGIAHLGKDNENGARLAIEEANAAKIKIDGKDAKFVLVAEDDHKAAKLKVSAACVEDIDWRASRSLDRSLMAALAGGDWLRNAQNLLITGATGCGKTWLGCALAHQAARQGFSVLYVRAGRLFDELHVAHGDGSFARRLVQLAKLDLLVIDDFAISPMGAPERNDLLEVLDDRVGTRSTLITSQLPVKAWHTYLDDPTLADAISGSHRAQQSQD